MPADQHVSEKAVGPLDSASFSSLQAPSIGGQRKLGLYVCQSTVPFFYFLQVKYIQVSIVILLHWHIITTISVTSFIEEKCSIAVRHRMPLKESLYKLAF